MATVSTNVDVDELSKLGADATMPSSIIEVDHIVTYEAAITRILAIIGEDLVEFTGTSKRAPTDKYNPDIGIMLSTGRAMERYAHAVLKRANGLVEHRDHIKQTRPEQLERSKRWHALQAQKAAQEAQQASDGSDGMPAPTVQVTKEMLQTTYPAAIQQAADSRRR